MLAGALIAALLAVFAIKYVVNQVVLGVVLNLLALGLDRLPLRRGDGAELELVQQRRHARGAQDSAAGQHPDHRTVAVRPEHHRVPDLRADLRRRHPAVPYPMGAADARGWRAPEGCRHGRHQRAAHPLYQRADRRHARRSRRRVVNDRQQLGLREEHDRRPRLHRARGGHLRPLESARRGRRRAAVRVRDRRCRPCCHSSTRRSRSPRTSSACCPTSPPSSRWQAWSAACARPPPTANRTRADERRDQLAGVAHRGPSCDDIGVLRRTRSSPSVLRLSSTMAASSSAATSRTRRTDSPCVPSAESFLRWLPPVVDGSSLWLASTVPGVALMPCGRCRQLLWEFGGADMLIDHQSGPLPLSEPAAARVRA